MLRHWNREKSAEQLAEKAGQNFILEFELGWTNVDISRLDQFAMIYACLVSVLDISKHGTSPFENQMCIVLNTDGLEGTETIATCYHDGPWHLRMPV